jgi:hypothetical protein
VAGGEGAAESAVRVPIGSVLRAFSYSRVESCSQTESTPDQTQVTQRIGQFLAKQGDQ